EEMSKSLFLILIATAAAMMAPQAPAQGDAAAGEAKSALCATCHGPDGNSELAINPKIAGQNARYLIKQMRDFQSGARPGPIMAAMVINLSEEDIADLAAYYAAQTPTLLGADPESVALAESLYRAGNRELEVAACSACHSPTGDGNIPAGFPALGGQHPEYTLQQLKDFRSGARANDPAGMMRIVAERLTDPELEALANYLAGLH
ncbi:MAG: c-type cytochrome, partial [Gammaproteobacteria bacterium]|nr:c-type cytochrome [Gammaproteobacteria bacterium]